MPLTMNEKQAVGYEVGMLHQFKCFELLSQGQVSAGFPPGLRSPSALCFLASNAVSFGCSSRFAGRALATPMAQDRFYRKPEQQSKEAGVAGNAAGRGQEREW